MTKAFTADRYGKGESDYINCPMTKEEYEAFYKELINAEKVELHDFEKGGLFEGCMPIEEMARRGSQTLTYGPLKPVGFGKLGDVYAVVQLRQDNKEGTLYNLVGFQTNLKFGEQKRVFSLIPALHDAEFVKYGVMHRNTFINSPELLDATYNLKGTKIFFAGQISGVEGYVESIASGLVSGINAVQMFNDKDKIVFDKETIIGSLAEYISTPHDDFQPMNANFGLFNTEKRFKSKQEKYDFYAQRALEKIKEMC
jgi:methylenetetrahydrofolate--tRNA-(uracil-5-)-methyltransferase